MLVNMVRLTLQFLWHMLHSTEIIHCTKVKCYLFNFGLVCWINPVTMICKTCFWLVCVGTIVYRFKIKQWMWQFVQVSTPFQVIQHYFFSPVMLWIRPKKLIDWLGLQLATKFYRSILTLLFFQVMIVLSTFNKHGSCKHVWSIENEDHSFLQIKGQIPASYFNGKENCQEMEVIVELLKPRQGLEKMVRIVLKAVILQTEFTDHCIPPAAKLIWLYID